jgi:hypothetical protein
LLRFRSGRPFPAENVAGVRRVNDHLAWIEPMSGMLFEPPGESGELPKAN